MGIDYQTLRFLLNANNVNFSHMVTLGRQDLLIFPWEIKTLLHSSGFQFSEGEIDGFYTETNQFADHLFHTCLKAGKIDSIDCSSFEGATIVHDLNTPIPETMHNRYSAVLDGGTLEHVFNFPVAIKNCMDMINIGGHFISVTPCNNMVGHGFYQFSPELFFRIFSEENGFMVERMIFFEDGGKNDECVWYGVSDPEKVKERVTAMSIAPACLIVQARKHRKVDVIKTPQQSDYYKEWSEKAEKEHDPDRLHFFHKQMEVQRRYRENKLKSLAKSIVPQAIKVLIKQRQSLKHVSNSLNIKHFKRLDL